jgi:hypothetical protein
MVNIQGTPSVLKNVSFLVLFQVKLFLIKIIKNYIHLWYEISVSRFIMKSIFIVYLLMP